MKNKELIAVIIALIIFAILVFTTPFTESKTASTIWMMFFTAIFLIAIIWILVKVFKTPKHELVENFKRKPAVIKILSVAIIISIIYYAITQTHIEIPILLLGIASFYELFFDFKKEE